MKIWIDIDSMKDQIARLSKNVDAVRSIITQGVVQEIYNQWCNQVRLNLTRNQQEYIDEIQVDHIMDNTYTIGIEDDSIAGKIEGGSPSWDMKPNFAKSAKAKQKKNGGWYLTIPFKLGTPNAINAAGTFSAILPRSVYNAVRKSLENNTPIQLPPKYDVLSKPHHKGPIFGGINASPNINGGQSYNTFRRVSDKSDPISWIYPARPGKHILQKVLAGLNIDAIIKQELDKLQ